MEPVTQADDDFLMSLVDQAFALPKNAREPYLQNACGEDRHLFNRALHYVASKEEMGGFLLDPIIPPLEASRSLQPGELLMRRFLIVREVAQGGMGIVWEAIDQRLGRRVALKAAKTGFGNHLPPEVRNASEIAHPNVCKIFEIHTSSGPDGDIDFMSMEFLQGETLLERLRRSPLSNHEARTIASQLCAGLAEAHRNNVIHGDLKTGNVILATNSDGSIRAVITDFGLARAAGATAALLGGTPAYMAPELWKGSAPSVSSDIYALGVMLWELHTGQAPSKLGIQSSTLPAGDHPAWKPPTRLGKWDRIIARCLNADPSARFSSATQVAEAFEPSRVLKWSLVIAAVVLFAAVSVLLTYRITTVPAQRVRLMLAPSPETSAHRTLNRDIATQLSLLQSTPHTEFRFIPSNSGLQNIGYSLRTEFEPQGGSVTLHADLKDLHSEADAGEWTAEYKPAQLSYAPAAIAAFVSSTFHLPPPTAQASVNAAARRDYQAGTVAVRFDKTMDQALGSFERAVKADPDSALTHAGLAEAQWFKAILSSDSGWHDKAAESVRQAQLRNSDLAPVHEMAGLLDSDAGLYEPAIGEYLRAIELEPMSIGAYRRLGDVYQRNEQIEEAHKALLKSVEIAPNEYRNRRALGNYYFQRGRYEDSIVQFQKALELAPDDVAPRNRLAVVYQDTGQFSLAEKQIRASLQQSETPFALHKLGLLLIYQHREQEAVPFLLRSVQKGEPNSVRWLNLGNAYRRLGQKRPATSAYRHGIELAQSELTRNPKNAYTRSCLAYLDAQLHDDRNAVSEVAQAVHQSPHDTDVQWMAAATYEALGRRADTLDLLRTSPHNVLADLSRWPDLADLSHDSRFLQLLGSQGK